MRVEFPARFITVLSSPQQENRVGWSFRCPPVVNRDACPTGLPLD